MLVAAKASSTSPTSCAKPAFLCGLSGILFDLLIGFADWLVITRLGIQSAAAASALQAGSLAATDEHGDEY